MRPGGYAIDFRGASVRVLERMGLLAEVQRRQTRTGAITIVDRHNKKLARMPDGFTSGELEILRGDLAEIFHEATRKTTEYIFDDSITCIVERDAGVDVTFEQAGSAGLIWSSVLMGCIRRCDRSRLVMKPTLPVISVTTFQSSAFLTI